MGVNVKLLQAIARANNQARELERRGWKNVKVRNPDGNHRSVFVRGTPPDWKRNVRRVKPEDMVTGEKIFISPAGVPFEYLSSKDGVVKLRQLYEGWHWSVPASEFGSEWRNA